MPKTVNAKSLLDAIGELLLEPDVDTPSVLPAVKPARLPSLKLNSKRSKPDGLKCAVLLPDTQIGFRYYPDFGLQPFHDVTAISVALSILATLQHEYGVDVVINLGDTMDLPQAGKYEQETVFAHTLNPSLKATHDYFASQRAICPDAEIVYIEGNHDCRVEKLIREKTPSLFGAKRVTQDDFPVMSLPHLLALDTLNVTYQEGYKAAKYVLNPKLIAKHGTKARSNGSTAHMYLNSNPHVSTLFGHSHRMETAFKTHDTPEGPVRQLAYSPGCLCRVDGAVPSTNGAVDLHEKPVTFYENWQQGIGVVWYKDDGDFTIESIPIFDGWAVYSGQEFRASV